MPLASLANLQFNGPGAGAARVAASAALAGSIGGQARANSTVSGGAAVVLAAATRLIGRPATITGTGSIVTAAPRARARITATVRVGVLTQDDVTGAVLEAQVQPGLTLRQALLDAREAAKLAAALSA